MEIMAPPGMEEMTEQLRSMFAGMGQERSKPRKVTVKEAFKHLCDEEAAKRIDEEELRAEAARNAEQTALAFYMESTNGPAGHGKPPAKSEVKADHSALYP